MRKGDEATDALTPSMVEVLRLLAKRGRAGATAKEIVAGDEAAGLEIGVKLLSLKRVTVTRSNRFLLTKYADSIPRPINWDDERHTGLIEHPTRAVSPSKRTSRPPVVDTTGIKITKLPPGEAIGARDQPPTCRPFVTEQDKGLRLRRRRRDRHCLLASPGKQTSVLIKRGS
jgi:hypothetical protein